jgi:hypothetical protein
MKTQSFVVGVLIFIFVALALLLLVISYKSGGNGDIAVQGDSGNRQTGEEIAQTIARVEATMPLAHKSIPPEPDESIDDATVEGVDTNNNGVRDYHENQFKVINIIPGATEKDYDDTVALIRMMQPRDPAVPNSINEHEIYCAYTNLSDRVRDRWPLNRFYSTVLNTEARKLSFRDSLEPSSVSLGEEICE